MVGSVPPAWFVENQQLRAGYVSNRRASRSSSETGQAGIDDGYSRQAIAFHSQLKKAETGIKYDAYGDFLINIFKGPQQVDEVVHGT